MATSRMIREGFLDSEKVAALSWRTECFFHRLLLVADDYGLFDARPTVLRTRLFPLHLDKISNQDIQDCLHETEEAGLVRAYCVGGKDYVQIINFGQRRQSKPKFPLPDGDSPCNTVSHGSSRESTVNNGESRKSTAYTETESNTDTYTKSETETKEASPDGSGLATPSSRSSLPLPSSPGEVEAHLKNEVARCRLKMLPRDISECSLQYWADRSGSGWVDRFSCPIADWKANALGYALRWARNLETKSGSDPFPDSADLGRQF